MESISVVGIGESEKWDEIVYTFKSYDIYYLSGYLKAFELHGDGTPQLYYYQSDGLRGICAMMKRDIANHPEFKGLLPFDRYFDIITPYGYGGFLFEGNMDEENLEKFNKTYSEFLKNENIVSEFDRFHPMLDNASSLRSVTEVIDLGSTVSMDLDSPELIWGNITSKNRNTIRKAEKNGIEIYHSKGLEIFNNFIQIYNATMEHDNATPYYFFDKQFYESIHNDLNNNYEMFYAKLGDEIVAMSIIMFANNKMHYHLSGSRFEYRSLAPTNLLLYKAACWGAEQGFRTFHLGGGLGSAEDSLYKFKKAFNRYSNNQFSIGKKILNEEVYNELVRKRLEVCSSFDSDSSFFPLYRS